MLGMADDFDLCVDVKDYGNSALVISNLMTCLNSTFIMPR